MKNFFMLITILSSVIIYACDYKDDDDGKCETGIKQSIPVISIQCSGIKHMGYKDFMSCVNGMLIQVNCWYCSPMCM